jgi:3-oxoacyl-[acyl-carrier protein] reductase|tara:strand:+ start:10290 stop:10964 length:675 start_codon:yes stop_codon:yes gene_type:complete
MFDFSNKTILVTGGTGGIGSAVAALFDQFKGNVIVTNSKLADFKSNESIITLLEELPDIDIWVNCAGINTIDELDNIKEEDFDNIMQVNVKAPFLIAKHLSKHMKKQKSGKIVNIASIWGDKTISKRLSYTTSKSALIGMTKTLAVELAKYNIQVNTVSPGFTNTKLTNGILSKKQIKELVSNVPMGRMADPAEIARIVMFLCSNQNTYITGQNIIVDGGFSIT